MLFQFANREITYHLCENFNVHFDRVRNVSLHSDPVHDSQIVADHQGVFRALLENDPETAKNIVGEHLNRCDVNEACIQDKFSQYILRAKE